MKVVCIYIKNLKFIDFKTTFLNESSVYLHQGFERKHTLIFPEISWVSKMTQFIEVASVFTRAHNKTSLLFQMSNISYYNLSV